MKLHHWRSVPLAALLLTTSGMAHAEADQTIPAFVASCFQYLDKPTDLPSRRWATLSSLAVSSAAA